VVRAFLTFHTFHTFHTPVKPSLAESEKIVVQASSLPAGPKGGRVRGSSPGKQSLKLLGQALSEDGSVRFKSTASCPANLNESCLIS
jgi:hypothetical protein